MSTSGSDFTTLKDRHAEAVRLSVSVVELAASADLVRPTPCAGWTFADLLAHMTAQHRGFAAAARGDGGDLTHWHVTPLGRDFAAEYAEASVDVIAAFAEVRDEEQEFALPEFTRAQKFPAPLAIGFHFLDYVVHAWDVARTLGRPLSVSDALADAALPIALAVPDDNARLAPGAAFAPGLSPAPAGTAMDRLLRALGRDPGWTAGQA
ncbi:TIGR03086 family metal-binding protein [Yinghuangia seranimata]|uniref:TIGR03086 family metal-binding protein n=1 Tax=Yinghuangia seranimata TaxID=408067 RepID=UPI00248C61BB|nr:TIGR03086 family metal-binding protein [Yinghuangia seranimata]MDI2128506.1 TIGR03086 family metal-binding protein [Yinghuangia seranimata]